MLQLSTWKTTLILLAVLVGCLFALPNLVPESQRLRSVPGEAQKEAVGIWRFLPSKGINLGLDLRGGSHLLYEVDIAGVRQTELEAALDRARAVARDESCGEKPAPGAFCPTLTSSPITADYLSLRVSDPAQFDEVYRRLRTELPRPAGGVLSIGGVQPRLYNVERGPQPGEIRVTVTDESLAEVRQRTVSQSIEIIRRRIDELGTTEPVIQRQGSERILVQAPGEQDPQRLKDVIGQTAQMTFHLVASDNPADIQRASTGRPPPGQKLLPTDDPREPYLLVQENLAVADTARGPDGRMVRTLTGGFLRKASQGFSQKTGLPVVNFEFNTTGAIIFGKLTANHVGERFAVVLDDKIITAPRINGAIPSGTGYIEGNFTVETASDLAALLNAGALPAKLTIVEQRTVGPSLGSDSVRAGAYALVVSFLAVVTFMIVAYGLFGGFASIALLVNVILLAAALSAIQATLTLPGIAGVILVIGMAVDANVLIYERIREESHLGRSPANAIQEGFHRAFATIIDTHLTALVAAALMFWFGSGPVRGFAVTLTIGLIASVFTAVVLSQLMISVWFRSRRPKVLRV